MTTKSFFGASIQDALHAARQEFGPEAMMLATGESGPEARHMGEFEVRCAVPDGAAGWSVGKSAPAPPSDWLATELAGLRRQLDAMRHSLVQAQTAAPPWLAPHAEACRDYGLLTRAEVEPDLAAELARSVLAQGGARPLAEVVMERLTVAPALGVAGAGRRIAALVGPPGAGKTTTVVKLAARYGLSARRPAHLISMDNHRVAAPDQLRCFASILGIGFQALDTPQSLRQALEELRGKELILIDTPGHSAHQLGVDEGLARLLSSHPEIDVHLVLPATMKPADLRRVVDAFEVFRPAKLLFTRIDETVSYGSIYNEAVRTGKPLSFLCGGQQIPEDLIEPRPRQLADWLLGAGSLPQPWAA